MSAEILFKAIFGYAFLAMALTGATFNLRGEPLPDFAGAAAAVVGGLFGLALARRAARSAR